jgi:uncharacterized repeat protein (TIGR01451 family)
MSAAKGSSTVQPQEQPSDSLRYRSHVAVNTRSTLLANPWITGLRRASCGLLSLPMLGLLGCGSVGGLALPANPFATSQLAQRDSATAQPELTTPSRPASAPAVIAASYADGVSPHASQASGTQYLPVAAEDTCAPMIYGSTTGCNPHETCSPGCGCTTPAAADTYRNAQEYIFDGGDLDPQVVVQKNWTVEGLNPTDTVIYYETLGGKVCEQPSNRVAIYAPRFGAVRQISGLHLSTAAIGTERILAPLAAERFDDQNLAGTVVVPVAPQGELQVGLIDAFQDKYAGTPLDQVQPLSRMSAARVPFELIDLRRSGLITLEELVDIRQLVQNAETWVIPESLTVEIANQPALEVKDTQAPEDLVLYETPDKCTMRICKVASHTIANSGDTVSFAIRFDNAGVKPLGNVVITDSLSPRLNYIEGSQQCSVGARFSAEPNDIGSMILRWEIEESVESSEGGVITFDCKVR